MNNVKNTIPKGISNILDKTELALIKKVLRNKRVTINEYYNILNIFESHKCDDVDELKEQIKEYKSYKLLSDIVKFIETLKQEEFNDVHEYHKETLLKLIDFLYSPKDKFYCLLGFAGTGKTSLIIVLIMILIKYSIIRKCAVNAPTNKAINVIKDKLSDYITKTEKSNTLNGYLEHIQHRFHITLDINTIHKLLGYSADYEFDSKKVFVQKSKSLFKQYDILFIDECSMIQAIIFYDIINNINPHQKVIFIGDPLQLPPVNEPNSLLFLKNKNVFIKVIKENLKEKILDIEHYFNLITNIDFSLLVNIIRTNQPNIMLLSQNIRDWIEKCNIPSFTRYQGNGVYFYKKKTMLKKWFQKYITYHKENFAKCIILVWRNETCKKYNDNFRKCIFNKEELEQYEIGDLLMIHDFYEFQNSKFYTSEQVKVLDIEYTAYEAPKFTEQDSVLNKHHKIEVLSLKSVQNVNAHIPEYKQTLVAINNKLTLYPMLQLYVKKLNETKQEESIIQVLNNNHNQTIHQDKKVIFDLIQKLVKHITKKKLQKQIIKDLWKQYYKILIENFAEVSYGAATTVHRSQSSSYDYVFIDLDDILDNPNIEEAKKCVYTAITRASKEVHILI